MQIIKVQITQSNHRKVTRFIRADNQHEDLQAEVEARFPSALSYQPVALHTGQFLAPKATQAALFHMGGDPNQNLLFEE